MLAFFVTNTVPVYLNIAHFLISCWQLPSSTSILAEKNDFVIH